MLHPFVSPSHPALRLVLRFCSLVGYSAKTGGVPGGTNNFDCPLPANLPDACNDFECSPVDTGSNGDPHLNFADGGKADERVERASSPVHGACTPLELAPAASPQACACPGSLCFTHTLLGRHGI